MRPREWWSAGGGPVLWLVAIDRDRPGRRQWTGMAAFTQDDVCNFVREILSARCGEPLEVTARPDRLVRNDLAVEELWDGPSRRFAVEHTRIESFSGQIQNTAWIQKLVFPVRAMLENRLPGYFELSVREAETTRARIDFADAHAEIVRLVLETARQMKDGDSTVLASETLPFKVGLRRRHGNGSRAVLNTVIEGDLEELRVARIRRAFAAKCPKLVAWSDEGRGSVLILESSDFQHANAWLVSEAVRQVLAERSDAPDIVLLVETDGAPMYGWVLKDGPQIGDSVPMPTGDRCYTQGHVTRTWA